MCTLHLSAIHLYLLILKRPEAKHSSVHQERKKLRQCAHSQQILSTILSNIKQCETKLMLKFKKFKLLHIFS